MTTEKSVFNVMPPPPESISTKASSPDSARSKRKEGLTESKCEASSASLRLPRVHVVSNWTPAIATELSNWTATWVSDTATGCTMTSKPGIGSGSRQGLQVPQEICGAIAHQRSTFSPLVLVCLSFIIRSMSIETYRACIERQRINADGDRWLTTR